GYAVAEDGRELGDLLGGPLLEPLLGLLALGLVDLVDDVLGEVEDLLQVARRDVQQQGETARRALEVPDVADGRGQLDVAHALAAHLGAGYLDAAFVAADAF